MIGVEIVGISLLKLLFGFKYFLIGIVGMLLYGLVIFSFLWVLSKILLSVGYVIWVGVGIVVIGLIGIWVFGEILMGLKMLGFMVIIMGVILLNMFVKMIKLIIVMLWLVWWWIWFNW